jgi:hypothetical protein
MNVHPHEPQDHVPITASPVRRRRSDLAIPVTLLAFAVILGIGITAFLNTPLVEPSTVGYATRGSSDGPNDLGIVGRRYPRGRHESL